MLFLCVHTPVPHALPQLFSSVTPRDAHAGAPVARSAVAGLGAGIGIGMGYTDCKHEFDALEKEQSGSLAAQRT